MAEQKEKANYVSTLNHLQEVISLPHNPNKHGSERMKAVLEKCSKSIYWHQLDTEHRAAFIQRSLPPEDLRLIRMVRLSVSDARIYMSRPIQFIRTHPPGSDREALLEDNSGRIYKVDFFDKNWCFSRGWTEFCAFNNLVKCDYLVFHMVQPSKFEVYIVKKTDNTVVDKAPTPNPVICMRNNELDKSSSYVNAEKLPRNDPGMGSQKQIDTTSSGVRNSYSNKDNLTPSEDLVCTQNITDPQNSKKTESFKKMRTSENKIPSSSLACSRQAMEIEKETEHQNSEKTESFKNMRKCKDKISSSSLACQAMEVEKEVYLASFTLGSVQHSLDKAPTIPNANGFQEQNELEKQGTFENLNAQLLDPSSCPLENLEVNTPFLVGSSHSPNVDIKPSLDVSDEYSSIIVDGIDITHRISKHTLTCYLKLCRSQKSFLHKHLVKRINIEYAISVITQMVNISRDIKTFNMSTSQEDIVYWRKMLKSSSEMGMDVGFMRNRIDRLLELTAMATKDMDPKKDEEAKAEAERLEERIKDFELQIEKMKEKKRKIDYETVENRKKTETFEKLIKQEASSPW